MPTGDTARLRSVGRRLAAQCGRKVEAAAVPAVGSVGAGMADACSELDLVVFIAEGRATG